MKHPWWWVALPLWIALPTSAQDDTPAALQARVQALQAQVQRLREEVEVLSQRLELAQRALREAGQRGRGEWIEEYRKQLETEVALRMRIAELEGRQSKPRPKRALEDRPVWFDFEDTPLPDVLEHFQRATHRTFVPDPALASATFTLHARNLPLRVALDLLCENLVLNGRRLRLTWKLEGAGEDARVRLSRKE